MRAVRLHHGVHAGRVSELRSNSLGYRVYGVGFKIQGFVGKDGFTGLWFRIRGLMVGARCVGFEG
jgi:hypothetical protein